MRSRSIASKSTPSRVPNGRTMKTRLAIGEPAGYLPDRRAWKIPHGRHITIQTETAERRDCDATTNLITGARECSCSAQPCQPKCHFEFGQIPLVRIER